MNRLFSSFDPQARILGLSTRLNWLSIFSCLLFFPQNFWLVKSQFSSSILNISIYLRGELKSVFREFQTPGTSIIFISFFFYICFSNFIGLFPYIFTASRHLVFTLSLALPLWMGRIILACLYQFNHVIAHLVPLGTPRFLMPVIVIIETISSIIRPLTLAVRLAANIIAGHLLLTLLGNQCSPGIRVALRAVIIALVLLLILECAVACIQSYVFTILRSLYLAEHINNEFSKKFL